MTGSDCALEDRHGIMLFPEKAAPEDEDPDNTVPLAHRL